MGNYSYTYGTFSAKFARLNVAEDTLFDDAGVSQIGVKYTFNFSGWITGKTLADFQVALNGAQCQLHQPRLPLVISWSDGGPTTTLYTFTSATDINFGPLPGTLNIQKFDGGLAALYNWSVSATSKTCYGTLCSPGGAPNQILSITRRWSYSINESGLTRRTVSGKLVTTAQGGPADNWRSQCVPTCPTTFKRESYNFENSENGRELTFSVVDQEVFNTLPIPVSSGRADFSVRTTSGLQSTLSLSGRFEATAAGTKADIYDQICILAAAKVPKGGAGGFIPFMTNRTITEDVYGNSVSFNFEWSAPNPAGVDILAKNSGWPWGESPPNSTGISQQIGVYGSDGTNGSSGVFTPPTPVNDACAGAPPPPANSSAPGNTTGNPGYGTNNPTQTPDPAVTTAPSVISPSHATNMWLEYHEIYSYEMDQGVVFFPSKVAGVPPLRQQVRNPMMTVIQSGWQTQYAQSATDAGLQPPPDPILGKQSLTHSSTWFDNPLPSTQAGYGIYTNHWTYTMVFAQAMPTDAISLGLGYPDDPRPLSPTGGDIDEPPDILPTL